MLTTARPMCFVATADAETSKRFYAETLGLTLIADEPWAIVFDLAGTMLRIQKAQSVTAHPYTALGWHVADVPAAVTDLQARGVSFERFPWMNPDSDWWTVPGAGVKVAWFKDPDGNLLSLTEGA